MALGNNPGNGKSSPFGNGQGGPAAGGSMPNNFNQNPGGSGARRAPASPMTTATPQKKLNNESDLVRNPKSVIPGGNTAAEITPPANSPSRYDIGVGSVGDGRKPFSVR